MKILHVIPAIAPRYGGPSTAVIQMSRALAAAGAEVHLASTDADGSGRLRYPLGEWVTVEGVRTILFRRQFSEAAFGARLVTALDAAFDDNSR